jgi:hypothetical protein
LRSAPRAARSARDGAAPSRPPPRLARELGDRGRLPPSGRRLADCNVEIGPHRRF